MTRRIAQRRLPVRVKTACFVTLAVAVATGGATAADPLGADEGRPHVSWQDAGKLVGRTAYVSGVVERVGHAKTIHFLNFDAKRRDVFKVVIFQQAFDKFTRPLEELYENKPIQVRGMVTVYAGAPQIVVNSPDQIEVLDALPEARPPRAAGEVKVGAEITVATFNVRNLFDAEDDPYHDDENTPAKPREELEKLAATIRALNADVLALQEVESRGYLTRFIEVFLPDAGYRDVVHFEGNDLRGIDVCLLSRLPVGAVTSYRHATFANDKGAPDHFRRDLLRVELQPQDGLPFEVWVVHLKSNSGGREHAEPVRLAEARAIRQLLDQRLTADPQAAIFVCGDFNDTSDSVTLETITGQGTNALHSGWSTLPPGQRITYNLEPYLSMIDFILWSPALEARYVKDSYQVQSASLEQSGSDHNPVRARFRIR